MSWTLTDSFAYKASLTNPTSMVRNFIFDGNDYSSLVMEYPIISRKASDIVGSEVTIYLDNSSQSFNSYINSAELYLTKTCSIGFGFMTSPNCAEMLGIYSGNLKEVSYNGMQVGLTFGDALTEARYNWQADTIYSDYPPTSLFYKIWDLYFDPSALFDVPSFNTWVTDITAEGLLISLNPLHRDNPNFETRTILQHSESIRELTDSSIGISLTNKLHFNKWLGVSSYSVTLVTSTILSVDNLKIDTNSILNSVRVYYDYNYVEQFNTQTSLYEVTSSWWSGAVTYDDSDSITAYGERFKEFQDTLLHCANSATAYYLAQRLVTRRAKPNVSMQVKTTLVGIQGTAGDRLFLTYAPYGISSKEFSVQGYSIDINDCIITFDLDIGNSEFAGNLTGFILDDPIYGLLDQTYNPVY